MFASAWVIPVSVESITKRKGLYPSPGSITSTDKISPLSAMFALRTASLIGVPQFPIDNFGGSLGSYPLPPFVTITSFTPYTLLNTGRIAAPDPGTVLGIRLLRYYLACFHE